MKYNYNYEGSGWQNVGVHDIKFWVLADSLVQPISDVLFSLIDCLSFIWSNTLSVCEMKNSRLNGEPFKSYIFTVFTHKLRNSARSFSSTFMQRITILPIMWHRSWISNYETLHMTPLMHTCVGIDAATLVVCLSDALNPIIIQLICSNSKVQFKPWKNRQQFKFLILCFVLDKY